MFEDKKGEELVYEQAQKNRRRLVKNDESITIGNDRQKYVKNDESDKTDGFVKQFVGKAQDIVVGQDKREMIGGDSNLHVQGERKQLIVGNQSLTVKGDRHEIIAEVSALAAEKEIHLDAKKKLVIHADDVTLRGPGGFIRINESGVTIRGKKVYINSGGSPAQGAGAKPELPEPAIQAIVDDVSKTLIGQ
jgi:type VI secretion system secreted protein VgrG